MFFKGTERRPTARDIGRRGRLASAASSTRSHGKEYTGYYVSAPPEHRDVALDVLVDMLRNSKFDAGEIDREKGVIIEERTCTSTRPRDFVGRRVRGAVYGRPATRLGHHRPQGDRGVGDARDVHRLLDAGTSRPRMVVGIADGSATGSPPRATSCSAT
jgi:hypothetical protein